MFVRSSLSLSEINAAISRLAPNYLPPPPLSLSLSAVAENRDNVLNSPTISPPLQQNAAVESERVRERGRILMEAGCRLAGEKEAPLRKLFN